MVKTISFSKTLWTQFSPLITSINQMEAEIQGFSEARLKEKTKSLKSLALSGKDQVDTKTLVESFALVREASRRTLGLRHYDTQLLGGLVLNENKIAEMRTGEGKTLVATAPAFANALSGKGVHIVTVNEYLAQRDAEWMGQIYRYLGLKVGLVQAKMPSLEKRNNYHRDITYLTSSEVGFDFLRDNLVTKKKDLVQRPFHYCIIDEVDSVLIDEARTPLIISGRSKVDLGKIIKAAEVVKFLNAISDYEIDQKAKSISLTSVGLKKAQRLLKVDSIYNSNEPWVPFILNALKAKTLFLKNIHYIIENNEVLIVDEFTGRIMEGRKWAEGLHSAIEAKEELYNLEGSETIASITYQNFFRLYPKIAGMTGTAKTEELEFEHIYKLNVFILPTFKPIQRLDLPDAIYVEEVGKWKAVAQECKKLHQLQRPILVGTTTIKNSEILSALLTDLKVPHKLLNAKPENIQAESEIIAQAGCLAAVTISTNMAGRGTDILLGGNPEYKAYCQTILVLQKILYDDKAEVSDLKIKALIHELKQYKHRLRSLENNFDSLFNFISIPNKSLTSFENLVFSLYQKILESFQAECKKEKEKVLKLGGLYVIGTERHESRRIDNQLRGRAGRQGDPGTSRFFLSLNDPLLKTFGGEKIKDIIKFFQMDDEDALESKFLSQALDSAQKKVEGFYYDQRKTLNKYDRVLDKQRLILYRLRKKILLSSPIRDLILELGEAVINDLVQYLSDQNQKALNFYKQMSYLTYVLNLGLDLPQEKHQKNLSFHKDVFVEELWAIECLEELNAQINKSISVDQEEKVLVLKYIDLYWSQHLENINFLKDAVSWQAYAQKDPFLLYEEQASVLFSTSLKECRDAIICRLFGAKEA